MRRQERLVTVGRVDKLFTVFFSLLSLLFLHQVHCLLINTLVFWNSQDVSNLLGLKPVSLLQIGTLGENNLNIMWAPWPKNRLIYNVGHWQSGNFLVRNQTKQGWWMLEPKQKAVGDDWIFIGN